MSSTNQGPAQTLSPNLSPVSFGLDANGVPVFYAGGSPAANSDYLGAFAWASLPAAASYAGYRARVTDRGPAGGVYVASNGVNWKPESGWANNVTRQLRIIPFGDSITQGSALFTGGVWQFGNAYPETSIYQAGTRFQIIRNAGISGNTTAQMLARLGSDVLAYAPDVVLLLGGTNDLSAGMSNAAIAATMSNLESMVRQMLQAGCLPVIMTIPVQSTFSAESRKIQPFYYALAQAYGLPLIDLYRLTVDPSTGQYLAGYSGDGTHPNPTGITAISAVVSSLLTSLSGAFCGPYLAAYSETSGGNFANLIRNGNFARAASAPTPDGWTVNATGATQTLVAATPGAAAPYNGNTFTYQKTGTGAVYALYHGNITTGFSVGDVLQYSGHLNVSGVTPSTAVGFTLGLDMSGSVSPQMRPFVNFPFNGDFAFCESVTVPAGVTGINPTLYLNGNDLATYKVNNLTLLNVTQMNAIWQPAP